MLGSFGRGLGTCEFPILFDIVVNIIIVASTLVMVILISWMA